MGAVWKSAIPQSSARDRRRRTSAGDAIKRPGCGHPLAQDLSGVETRTMKSEAWLVVVYLAYAAEGFQIRLEASRKDEEEERQTEKVEIENTTGALTFEDAGTMRLGTVETAMIITLDTAKFSKVLTGVEKRVVRMFDHENKKGVIPDWWVHRITDLRQEASNMRQNLEDDAALLRKETERMRRDVWNWLLGVFNFFSIQDVKGHVERTQEATRLTAHTVDVMEANIRTTDNNLKELLVSHEGLEKQVQFMGKYDRIIAEWEQLRRSVTDAGSLIHAALDHRLHPVARNLIPLHREWETFKTVLAEKGLEPAFGDYQHLFSSRTDAFMKEDTLVVVIRVPAAEIKKRDMNLLRWRGGPLFLNGSTMVVDTEEMYLAYDGEGWYTTLTEREAKGCFMSRETFCPGRSKLFRHTGSSCLFSIWQEDWRSVAQVCRLSERRWTTKTWDMGKDVLVYNEKKMVGMVTCDGNVDSPVTLHGLQVVKMADGCKVNTENMVLQQEMKLRESVTFNINIKEENATILEEEWIRRGDRPHLEHLREMRPIAERVETMLAADSDWTTYLAVGAGIVAVVALMVVAGFIIFVIRRVNLGAVAARVAGEVLAPATGDKEDGEQGGGDG